MCQTLPCRVKICEPSLVLTLMHWVRGHSLVSPWLDARWNATTTETETNCGTKKFLESRFQLGLDAAPVTSRDLMQGPTNQTETKTNYGAKKCPEAVLYCASAFFGASDPLGKYWQPLIIRWAQEVQRSSCTQRKYCTDLALILAPKRNIFSKSAIICVTSLKIFFWLWSALKRPDYWFLFSKPDHRILGGVERFVCMPAMPSVATFLATLRYFGCHPPVLLKRQCVQSTNIWHN